MSKNCTSYRNTVKYDQKRVKMGGKNRCYSRSSLKRRDGVWYHSNKKRYFTRNKNNPGPYAKISRLGERTTGVYIKGTRLRRDRRSKYVD